MMIVQIHHTQYQVSLNVAKRVDILVCAPSCTVLQGLIVWYPNILMFCVVLYSLLY
jgi:alpha-D-ribose 1-methylphosphonate 5-triphosphate synthase subunit PhnL